MRALTKAFVGATTAVGIAVGGLATAGTAVAAPVPAQQQVVSADTVAPLAVDNHGLTTTEARYVQCWLVDFWGYPGPLDGQLGTNSWKAMQRGLAANWGYTGAIDGIPGTNTNKALQRQLKAHDGYTGAVDGVFGSGSIAAFKRFAAGTAGNC